MTTVNLVKTRLQSRVDPAQQGSALQIDGIPASVEWTDVAAILTSLGISLRGLTRDGVRIGWDAITCTVYAENADGNWYLDHTGDAAAVHHISIPIEH